MKRLVLLGGGHAHVHVLRSLAVRPIADVQVHLVTPFSRQVYSGMLPGWIAGHYLLDECVIPLPPLVHAAQARSHAASALRIDADRRAVHCTDGSVLPYDVLSIDVGSAPHDAGIEGADTSALPIRPLENFIAHVSALKAAPPPRLALLGAGAAGVELALALRHGLRTTDVALISAANTLPGHTASRVLRALKRANVTLIAGQPAVHVDAAGIHLADGHLVGADVIVTALGPRAPRWLKESGLACDDDGYLMVDDCLRSVSHADIFAAGDCASRPDAPRPKSGVYAVRAGPPLAENLRRALSGVPLKSYFPQRHALYLLATGPRHAIGTWGPFAWEGAWTWHWKDRIDRAFIRRYTYPVQPVAIGMA